MAIGTTSAGALHDILSAVHRHKPPNERFLSALANVMDQTGEHSEINALSRLQILFLRVREDIEALHFDESLKNQAKSILGGFSGIENLSNITMNIANINSNCINEDGLKGLKLLHMVMDRRTGHPYNQAEIDVLAEKLRKLRAELPDVDLPAQATHAIDKRLGQIIEILTRFGGYGADDLSSESKALIGEITVEGVKAKGKAWEYLKRLGAAAAICYAIADGGNEAIKLGLELHENSEKFIKLFREEVPLLEGPRPGVGQVDDETTPRSPEAEVGQMPDG